MQNSADYLIDSRHDFFRSNFKEQQQYHDWKLVNISCARGPKLHKNEIYSKGEDTKWTWSWTWHTKTIRITLKFAQINGI